LSVVGLLDSASPSRPLGQSIDGVDDAVGGAGVDRRDPIRLIARRLGALFFGVLQPERRHQGAVDTAGAPFVRADEDDHGVVDSGPRSEQAVIPIEVPAADML
jgi:hypothetical protein